MSSSLSDQYCEGWCRGSVGKGKFSDCTGCEIYPLEVKLARYEQALETIANTKGKNWTIDAHTAKQALENNS